MNPISILEYNALTMNSVAALMASHNTVNPNSILEYKCAIKNRALCPHPAHRSSSALLLATS
jgi:hypothetical protein